MTHFVFTGLAMMTRYVYDLGGLMTSPTSPLCSRRGVPKNQVSYRFRGVRSERLSQNASEHIQNLPGLDGRVGEEPGLRPNE